MHTETLLQRAFSVPGQLYWDEDNQFIALLNENKRLLAAMSYIHADIEHLRVSLVVAHESNQGLGYRVYLGAMAALHPFTLSADDCSVTGHSVRIWQQLYNCDGLVKKSLYASNAYNPKINTERYEELALSNAHKSGAPLLASTGLLDEPGSLEVAIKTGALNPHIYNMGFSLGSELIKLLEGVVTPVTFSHSQVQAINAFLSDDESVSVIL